MIDGATSGAVRPCYSMIEPTTLGEPYSVLGRLHVALLLRPKKFFAFLRVIMERVRVVAAFTPFILVSRERGLAMRLIVSR